MLNEAFDDSSLVVKISDLGRKVVVVQKDNSRSFQFPLCKCYEVQYVAAASIGYVIVRVNRCGVPLYNWMVHTNAQAEAPRYSMRHCQ